MTMDWQIDLSGPNKSNSELTPTERAYIAQGYTADYSKNERQKLPGRIKNKSDKLPIRFKYLIKDIALFHEFGELGLRTEMSFEDSPSLKLYNTGRYATEYSSIPNPSLSRENHRPTRFGLELGTAMRLIFEDNDAIDEYRAFLWGMVLSEIEPTADNEQEGWKELFRLWEQFSEYYDHRVSSVHYNADVASQKQDQKDEATWIARSLLVKKEIKPSEGLLDSLVEQAYSSSHENPSEQKLEETINEYISAIRLTEYIKDCIKSDAQYLSSQEQVGIAGDELVECLWENLNLSQFKPTVDINDIKQEFNKPQAKVTKALRQLYNYYDKGSGPRYEITQEVDDHTWRLTGYGKALAVYMIEAESFRWMHESYFDNVSMSRSASSSTEDGITLPLDDALGGTTSATSVRDVPNQKAIFEEASVEIVTKETNHKYEDLIKLDFTTMVETNSKEITQL
jgi:hypothetical protein